MGENRELKALTAACSLWVRQTQSKGGRDGYEMIVSQFRQAVEICLPWAKIVVVDKFHLIRHINGALDKVRSRLQEEAEGVGEKTYSRVGIPCSRELRGLLIERRQS